MRYSLVHTDALHNTIRQEFSLTAKGHCINIHLFFNGTLQNSHTVDNCTLITARQHWDYLVKTGYMRGD